MNRSAIGSAAFFVVAPGTVAGVLPWWITGWRFGHALPEPVLLPGRIVGALLVACGVAVLLHAFARFVRDGLGTPAPIAPTRHLVVSGLYRHVRNPMYVAVFATLLGQTLLFGRPALLLYAAVVAVPTVAFVHGYEEPTLSDTFGAQYAAYRANVPAWWPRLHPWP